MRITTSHPSDAICCCFVHVKFTITFRNRITIVCCIGDRRHLARTGFYDRISIIDLNWNHFNDIK